MCNNLLDFVFTDTWFTAPVSRDEASLKSYEGVAISLLTPKIPQTYVKVSLKNDTFLSTKSNNAITLLQAEIYLTREVDGIVVERSEGWDFSFINDLQELGSIR